MTDNREPMVTVSCRRADLVEVIEAVTELVLETDESYLAAMRLDGALRADDQETQ